jgi:multidrug resistance efflux pump
VLVFSTRNDRLALDGLRQELALTEAQIAGYREAEAHLDAMLQRKRAMARDNLVSLEDVDRYMLELDRVRSERLAAQKNQAALAARIGLLENNLAAARIISPVAGVVMTRNMEELESQFVPAGEKVCEVANPDSLRVQAEVLEKQYRKVRVGQAVSVAFPMYPFQKFKGRVVRVGVYSGPSLRNERRVAQRSGSGDIYFHLNSQIPKTFIADVALEHLPPGVAAGVDAKVAIQVAYFRMLDLILKLGMGSWK